MKKKGNEAFQEVYFLRNYMWKNLNPFAPELPVTARADPRPF